MRGTRWCACEMHFRITPIIHDSKTLEIDLLNQDFGGQDQVLVLVSTKYSNQDKSWSWSQTRLVISQNFEFSKTLGIDIENQDLIGQDQVLVSTQF